MFLTNLELRILVVAGILLAIATFTTPDISECTASTDVCIASMY